MDNNYCPNEKEQYEIERKLMNLIKCVYRI